MAKRALFPVSPHLARWPRALDPGPGQDCQGQARQGAAPLQPLRGAGVPLDSAGRLVRVLGAPVWASARSNLPVPYLGRPPRSGIGTAILWACGEKSPLVRRDFSPLRGYGLNGERGARLGRLAPTSSACPGLSHRRGPRNYQNEAQPATDSSNGRRVPRSASDSGRPFGQRGQRKTRYGPADGPHQPGNRTASSP